MPYCLGKETDKKLYTALSLGVSIAYSGVALCGSSLVSARAEVHEKLPVAIKTPSYSYPVIGAAHTVSKG